MAKMICVDPACDRVFMASEFAFIRIPEKLSLIPWRPKTRLRARLARNIVQNIQFLFKCDSGRRDDG